MFYLVAIYLLASKKESGLWVAIGLTLITISVNLTVFVDRIDMPSGLDWLKGALLSIVLMVILFVPRIQDGVLERN